MTGRPRTWRRIEDITEDQKDGRPVELGWLPNGPVEFQRVSCWIDGQWMGGWTPTHYRPAREPRSARVLIEGVVNAGEKPA